jgi:ABC-type uncharacterized transport system fused permease/ATPase subunit
MQIVPANRNATDVRGAKVLVVGPSGVGKTSLLRTVATLRTRYF